MRQISLTQLKNILAKYPHVNSIEKFLNNIKKEDISLIGLFGSLVKGEYTPRSDIDVIVVFEKSGTQEELFHRAYQYSDGIIQPEVFPTIDSKHGET